MTEYVPRYIDQTLTALLEELPAVMLTGPRGCGKTTTAARHTASELRLDRPEQAAAFNASPDAVLATLARPVLIDEWQEAPASVGAVKRAVDADSAPGQYVMTGSVRARQRSDGWAATGRVTPIAMHGLSVGEIERRTLADSCASTLFASEDPAIGDGGSSPSLPDYLEHAVRGGFPGAIGLSDVARSAWYDGYIDQLIRHDVPALADVRSPTGLLRLLRAVALNTAGTPAITTLSEAARLDHRTVRSHLDLLEDLRIIDRVPAWSTNRLTRMVKAEKYYVTDSGLAAHLVGADVPALLSDGDRLGRLIDTFVLSQLRPILHSALPRIAAFHMRNTNQDHEVDLLLESPAGAVVAIEIKAASAVDARSARHLVWLRDRLGPSFHRGIVLHTGATTYPLSDHIWAMPIARLWSR